MAQINQGRWTAEIEGDFVLFPHRGEGGHESYSIVNVLYRRSFEHLEAFASNLDDPLPAEWRNVWKRVGKETLGRHLARDVCRAQRRARGGVREQANVRKAGKREARARLPSACKQDSD